MSDTIKLLSIPPDAVGRIQSLEHLSESEFFCSCDPVGSRLGSGGGTTWILDEWTRAGGDQKRKKMVIHAGGQSRRLPAYAPVGKIFTPVPVFRWKRGQRLGQNLLDLQLPLYEKILAQAPANLTTLIASGDVYIRAEKPLQAIPEADVVCYGLWVDASLATHHGVFVNSRQQPEELRFMLQKPSLTQLEELSKDNLFLMDIGIWLLSDKAVGLLRKHSTDSSGNLTNYDLYGQFGLSLGSEPRINDPELNALKVAILPLPGGQFYHFGTTAELLSSTLALQNLVLDQRKILHRKIKANPALFVQNVDIGYRFTQANNNVWVENSCVPATWTLSNDHVITGVPHNNWSLTLPEGVCLDIVPIGDSSWAARPYGYRDQMRGALADPTTLWMGQPYTQWASLRHIDVDSTCADIQNAPIFPIADNLDDLYALLRYMISEPDFAEGAGLYSRSRKVSADEIANLANLDRLYAQRAEFQKLDWTLLAANHKRSIFYQLDLVDTAQNYCDLKLEKPMLLPPESPEMDRIRNLMLRSRIDRLNGAGGEAEEAEAFAVLRDSVLSVVNRRVPHPVASVYPDQIVWGRSPVRIDLAGGWTDTPPYSLFSGGNVVNIAIELNGQPPIQVFIKPTASLEIVLRSIDLGAEEHVGDFDRLYAFNTVLSQ